MQIEILNLLPLQLIFCVMYYLSNCKSCEDIWIIANQALKNDFFLIFPLDFTWLLIVGSLLYIGSKMLQWSKTVAFTLCS